MLRVVVGDVLAPTVSVYGAWCGDGRMEGAAGTVLKMFETVAGDFCAKDWVEVLIEGVQQLRVDDGGRVAYDCGDGAVVTVDDKVYETTVGNPYRYRLKIEGEGCGDRRLICKQVFLVTVQVLLYVCGMLGGLGKDIQQITLRREIWVPRYPTTTVVYGTGRRVELPEWYGMLFDLGNLSRRSKTFSRRGRVTFRGLAAAAVY